MALDVVTGVCIYAFYWTQRVLAMWCVLLSVCVWLELPCLCFQSFNWHLYLRHLLNIYLCALSQRVALEQCFFICERLVIGAITSRSSVMASKNVYWSMCEHCIYGYGDSVIVGS